MTVAKDLISEAKNDPIFMKRIIINSEARAFKFNVDILSQSSKGCLESEPKPKKRSKVRVLSTIFYDFRSIEHFEYLPPDHTINKENQLSVLKGSRNVVRPKRPELWYNN